jgi:glucosamine--fructose-6-phosphate aminotransferase (isomerizing)
VLTKDDAVILISQSGETADTLAALRLAKERGAYTVAVVNVGFSTIARESDATLQTLAGPEIAVASTKAYTVQTALLLLLSVSLGVKNGEVSVSDAKEKTALLTDGLPRAIEETLALSDAIRETAKTLADAQHLFFIGRNQDYISSLEASLKLKEISYIHSEAYAAGELKHGTISLIEKGTPVIAVSTLVSLREKLLSNLKETLARGARAVVVCERSAASYFAGATEKTILLPDVDPFILPIVAATALQLLAFHVAFLRGCDVDKPRNLAKSVTVE